MTGADVLLECLVKRDVKAIFGVPGTQLCEIYAAIHKRRESITYITARHEGGASLMAVGYARASGKVGVCITIPGPGTSNAYTGILEAYTACDPVLLITAQDEPRSARKDPAKVQHGFDLVSAFAPVTKCIEIVERAEQIPQAVARVFRGFHTHRPKPALIEIARSALSDDVSLDVDIQDEKNDEEATEEQIDRVIDLLAKSKRPFIIAGCGIYHSRAFNELKEFAALLNAPVATTALGKGVISEQDPLSAGYIKTGAARKAMKDSDLIIALGARFVQTDTDNWALHVPRPFIQIDADPGEINKEYTSDIGIAGNLKTVLGQLIEAVTVHATDCSWESRTKYLTKLRSSQGKLKYLQQLRHALAKDAILSLDVHRLGYPVCRYFEIYQPYTLLHSAISMTLGFALPAAIGAKIARPHQQVVVFSGDGGFMLSSPELATIMQYNLNIVIIIINDNAYGTIKDIQLTHSKETIGVDLYNPDFKKYAESFGVSSYRVKGIYTLAPTLKRVLASGKPALIEVMPVKSIKTRLNETRKAMLKQILG